ncbi:MAG: hypothetical protein GPOALKHO_000924 [Sodalis sp.]|uniref:hypothetical protein n=1 Tax=Sodalis sp. (in: enterobacteria) TaxID=1898979 RepID=UPI00387322C8|nr:MAG: hypothetical protein GPOALKHO_000924 [Sodalis sp.]
MFLTIARYLAISGSGAEYCQRGFHEIVIITRPLTCYLIFRKAFTNTLLGTIAKNIFDQRGGSFIITNNDNISGERLLAS